MEKSTSQKVVKVLSILGIICAVVLIGFGALFMAGSNMMGAETETLIEGFSNDELKNLGLGIGVDIIIEGVFVLITSIFGILASNDPQKFLPYWICTLIGLILSVVSIALAFATGGDVMGNLPSYIGGIVGAAILFVLANNIKNQAVA